jgi:prophage regulatory protein
MAVLPFITPPGGPSSRILRTPETCNRTGLTAGQIGRLERRGDFPTRVRLTARVVGWVETEVDAWITRRLREQRGPQKQPRQLVRSGRRCDDDDSGPEAA